MPIRGEDQIRIEIIEFRYRKKAAARRNLRISAVFERTPLP